MPAPRFVKRCPQCGKASPESEMLCAHCGHYLGGVAVVEADGDTGHNLESQPDEATGAPADAESMAMSAEPLCLLESLQNGESIKVRSGQVLGQAHATSNADVQLAGFPGVEYVSRRHCRLEQRQGAWFLTALEDALNPTFCNRVRLAPGGQVRLRDGDEVTLAAVSFTVKLPRP